MFYTSVDRIIDTNATNSISLAEQSVKFVPFYYTLIAQIYESNDWMVLENLLPSTSYQMRVTLSFRDNHTLEANSSLTIQSLNPQLSFLS
jgi:hypothetical protein